MIAECAQCGREMSQVQEVCLWCDRPKVKKRGRRRGGPVDVATFIESTLNPREDGRELTEGMPRSHLKDGYYKELAETEAKVHPACTLLPKAPPGRAA